MDALVRPNRPRLVEALAVYFDPDTTPEETIAFQAMAGVLTPGAVPVGAVRADAGAAERVAVVEEDSVTLNEVKGAMPDHGPLRCRSG